MRKQRRGRLPLWLAGIMGVWVLWTMLLISDAARKGGVMASLDFALPQISGMSELFTPILIGIIATRLVAVDHDERFGQVFSALGQPPERRFAAKLIILVGLALICTALLYAVLVGFGTAVGMQAGAQTASNIARCLAVAALSTIPVAAIQLVLSTRFPERPVGIIAAVVAAFVTTSLNPLGIGEFGWLLPWTMCVAASPLLPLSAYHGKVTHLLTVDSSALDLTFLVILGGAWVAAALWYSTRIDQE